MKVNRDRKTFWLACGALMLATAGLTGAANAQRRDVRPGDPARVTGPIRRLNRDSATFLMDSDAGDRDISIQAENATFTGRDTRPGIRFGLRDLREGDVVEVYGTWRDRSTIRADRVARTGLISADDDRDYSSDRDPYDSRDDRYPNANRNAWARDSRTSDGLTGTVSGATGNVTRTMKVRALGRTYSVEVPRDTRVYRNGRAVSVHELKDGDRVRIRGDWRGDRLRADRVDAVTDTGYGGGYNGGYDRPGRNDRGVTGTIERIDPRGRTFRLRTPYRTYDVDARDADVMSASRNRRFADLREGERVTVTGEVRGSRLVADQIRDADRYDRDTTYSRSDRETITGTVEDVDALNRTFRIRGLSGGVTIRVTADSELRDADGGRIAFRDLREGDRVRVSGDRSGSFLVADRVEMTGR
jgi:hypothetical protein